MAEEKIQTTELEEEQFEPVEDLEQFQKPAEDLRLGASEEDNDDDDDEIDADKRDKRREERKARRERQREARERQERELNFLRNRNEQLERRFSELDQRVGRSELRVVDTQLSELDQQIRLADEVITQAINNQKGEEAVEAQGIRQQLMDRKAQLNNLKAHYSTPQQPRTDPRLIRLANNWMTENSWWDPRKRDVDSQKVTEIDTGLVQEGYDPTTPEYWNELTRRAKEQLPHRYQQQQSSQPSNERGPTFVQGGNSSRKPNQVYISPERKAAMIEAGVWEDPKLRQRYLKQYAAYDREHGKS